MKLEKQKKMFSTAAFTKFGCEVYLCKCVCVNALNNEWRKICVSEWKEWCHHFCFQFSCFSFRLILSHSIFFQMASMQFREQCISAVRRTNDKYFPPNLWNAVDGLVWKFIWNATWESFFFLLITPRLFFQRSIVFRRFLSCFFYSSSSSISCRIRLWS